MLIILAATAFLLGSAFTWLTVLSCCKFKEQDDYTSI